MPRRARTIWTRPLTEGEQEYLVHGACLLSGNHCDLSEDELKAAWFKHRAELMTHIGSPRQGRRPWAFWQYEHPEAIPLTLYGRAKYLRERGLMDDQEFGQVESLARRNVEHYQKIKKHAASGVPWAVNAVKTWRPPLDKEFMKQAAPKHRCATKARH